MCVCDKGHPPKAYKELQIHSKKMNHPVVKEARRLEQVAQRTMFTASTHIKRRSTARKYEILESKLQPDATSYLPEWLKILRTHTTECREDVGQTGISYSAGGK